MKLKLINKRLAIVCITVISTVSINLIAPLQIARGAEVVGIDGGIMNATSYQEYSFLDGTPVLLTGVATVKTNSQKKGTETVKIDYKLAGKVDPTNILTRSISYTRVVDTTNNNNDQIQNVKYTETVTINGTTYTLAKQGGYQISKADTLSTNAAIDFQTGDWNAIKTYAVAGTKNGTLVVTIQAREASNKNYWGEAHFQLIKYDLDFKSSTPMTKTSSNNNSSASSGSNNSSSSTSSTNTTSTATSTSTLPWQTAKKVPTATLPVTSNPWTGHVEVKTSSQRYGSLNYQSSLPVTTAYRGTYTRTDLPIAKAIYEYQLPDDSDVLTISMRDNPIIQKYVAKVLKDVNVTSGDDPIQKVTSLGLITADSYYAPKVNISRQDFLKALLIACNIKSEEKKENTNQFLINKRESLFLDVDKKNAYYPYIKDAIDYGIIKGVRGGYFKGGSAITVSEAAVMIARALGLNDASYIDGTSVKFNDDKSIPIWANDDIHTLAKLGVLKGDKAGNVYPTTNLTRAVSAQILDNLLKYLQKDVQKNYDDLVNFNQN